MASENGSDNGPRSNDLVARVNMDPDEALKEPDDGPSTMQSAGNATAPELAEPPRAPIYEVIPLALIALIIIVVSLIVILQGVFEMIPD